MLELLQGATVDWLAERVLTALRFDDAGPISEPAVRPEAGPSAEEIERLIADTTSDDLERLLSELEQGVSQDEQL